MDRSTLGVDVWGDRRPEVVTVGPQKGTSQDAEKDREGGHGSTSQLNLTISLPRASRVHHVCPPFRALNWLAGQTHRDLQAGNLP